MKIKVPDQPCCECAWHVPSMGCQHPDLIKRHKCCWGEINEFKPAYETFKVKQVGAQ